MPAAIVAAGIRPPRRIAYAKAHRHPELAKQTIWEVLEAERSKLVPYSGRFDGYPRAIDGARGLFMPR